MRNDLIDKQTKHLTHMARHLTQPHAKTTTKIKSPSKYAEEQKNRIENCVDNVCILAKQQKNREFLSPLSSFAVVILFFNLAYNKQLQQTQQQGQQRAEQKLPIKFIIIQMHTSVNYIQLKLFSVLAILAELCKR